MRYAALEPVPGYSAVIFRRTSPQITLPGGLWDESQKLYTLIPGAKPNQNRLRWAWPKHKTSVEFSHMQYDSDRFNWQGSAVPYIGFDELTHFSEEVVFYMLSRNRSLCGVKPRIRATTNPDPDSWVKRFLAPWVDKSYPNPAAPGEVRWFLRDGGELIWLKPGQRHPDARSVTFIPAKLSDNPAMRRANPSYEANLKALSYVERARLLYGDWDIRAQGNMFKREWFRITDVVPLDIVERVRFWDLAGTEPNEHNKDPDWTAGVLMGRRKDGRYIILDVVHIRESPHTVEQLVLFTARLDGKDVEQCFEQEPGSAGKAIVARYRSLLDGYNVRAVHPTGDKETRARPFSSQVEGGNVEMLRALWNTPLINELCAFPEKGIHDDLVDACDGAYSRLVGDGREMAVATLSFSAPEPYHVPDPPQPAEVPEHPLDDALKAVNSQVAQSILAQLDRYRSGT